MTRSRGPEPTEAQLEVMRAIESLSTINGKRPSYREIAENMGLRSHQGVYQHVILLERKGYVKAGEGPRSVSLTPSGRKYLCAKV